MSTIVIVGICVVVTHRFAIGRGDVGPVRAHQIGGIGKARLAASTFVNGIVGTASTMSPIMVRMGVICLAWISAIHLASCGALCIRIESEHVDAITDLFFRNAESVGYVSFIPPTTRGRTNRQSVRLRLVFFVKG